MDVLKTKGINESSTLKESQFKRLNLEAVKHLEVTSPDPSPGLKSTGSKGSRMSKRSKKRDRGDEFEREPGAIDLKSVNCK